MPAPKVFYRGSNPKLLHALRLNSGDALQVEQISESFSFQELAQMPDIGMLVLQHEPASSENFAPLSHWQRENPHVPVLVLTSDYTPETTKFLLRSGAKGVLPLSLNDAMVTACYETFLPGFRQKNVSKMVNQFKINYFGLLEISLNGQKIEFNWQAKMLLGYLAYHAPKSLARDHLARVFWPEKHENQPESARRSLNVELNHIRKAIRQQTGLAQDPIVFEKNCYRLQLDQPLVSDVSIFKAFCQKILMLQREGQPLEDALFQQAIQTYSSNFLDDCPEDALNWVEVERQHLGGLFEQIADLYSARLFDQGEYYRASAVCHEILMHDQRMEVIHRRLMICYGKLGMCHKVEQQYRLLCQIMEREFQAKPSAETTRLYQQIKQDCSS